jgi:hypothetical protein
MAAYASALLLLAAVLAGTPVIPSQTSTRSPRTAKALADSCERKLQYLERNGARATPDPRPTELMEDEINACFSEGRIELPRGVKQVRFTGANGHVTADARVDFDEIRAGRDRGNPLLLLFSGTHDVRVEAKATGADGRGTVQVQKAFINDVEVPRAALDFFVRRFLTPRYPGVGMTSTFDLPARIDSAVIGEKKLALIQK